MEQRRSVALELAGIGVAAALFLATFSVRPPYVDFALAAIAVSLVFATSRRSRQLWQIAPQPLAKSKRVAWLQNIAFTALALLALAVLAALLTPMDSDSGVLQRLTNVRMPLAASAYFPWAVLQQYLFQRYLLGRLLHLAPPRIAIMATALAFSCVHFPRWPVMGVTAIAGLFWCRSYYHHRTLIPLAASHAMLGAALHYWVFGRDLLANWIGR